MLKRWNTNTHTIVYTHDDRAPVEEADAIIAISNAMAKIERICGLKLTLSSSGAGIPIGWATPYEFAKAGRSFLARAYAKTRFKTDGIIIQGHIKLKLGSTFEKSALEPTILHELGHAFGFPHFDGFWNVMKRSIGRSNREQGLSFREMQGYHERYSTGRLLKPYVLINSEEINIPCVVFDGNTYESIMIKVEGGWRFKSRKKAIGYRPFTEFYYIDLSSVSECDKDFKTITLNNVYWDNKHYEKMTLINDNWVWSLR